MSRTSSGPENREATEVCSVPDNGPSTTDPALTNRPERTASIESREDTADLIEASAESADSFPFETGAIDEVGETDSDDEQRVQDGDRLVDVLGAFKLQEHARQIPQRLRAIGVTALVGIGLSLLALGLDRHFAASSTAGQDAIRANQLAIHDDISSLPEETANRVAEFIGIQAALREDGPLRDLADLAQTADPTRKAASNKVHSGDPQQALDGASELRDLAARRAQAVDALGRLAAEDYREAGAAFLVVEDLEGAIESYSEAARLDPGYSAGQITLSELALQAGDIALAQSAANAAIGASDGWWERRFALQQLGVVKLAQTDMDDALRVAVELEKLTRESAERAFAARAKFGSLQEHGLSVALTSGADTIAVFYDGKTLGSYRFDEDFDGTEKSNGLILAAETSANISRDQLIESLHLKATVLTRRGSPADLAEAEGALEETVILAREQASALGMPGVEVYIADALAHLATVRHSLDNLDGARAAFNEAIAIRRATLELLLDTVAFEASETVEPEDVVDYRRKLARALYRRSGLLVSVDPEQALKDANESLTIASALFNETASSWDRGLVVASMFVRGTVAPTDPCESLHDIIDFREETASIPDNPTAGDVFAQVEDLLAGFEASGHCLR